MNKSKKLRPAFKIHGGKWYLAEWIISLFPPNYESMDYVEPYSGAASVWLNKNPSTGIEVLNDINLGVTQIFKALRDEPKEFISTLKKIKYSERVFKRELDRVEEPYVDYLDHAVSEFIVRRMSRGGLKKNFAWSERQRGGQPGDVNAWKTIIGALPLIAERIAPCHIHNLHAPKVIKAYDHPNVLMYIDPPYDPDSRVAKNAYEHEMTTEQHVELSEDLHKCKSKIIISGYPSKLYSRLYSEWRCEKKKIINHSSQKKKKEYKIEACWMNF